MYNNNNMMKSLKTGSYGTAVFSEAAVSITNIKEESGVLIRIIVGTKAAGNIICYDAVSGTSNKLLEIDTTNEEKTYELGINFNTGLRWVTTGLAKITLVYL